MSKKLIVSYFDNWLEKNIDRFKYKPIKIGFNKYRFEGIIDSIILQITKDTREVTILMYSPNKFQSNESEIDYDMKDISWFYKVQHIKDKGYTDLGWIDEYKDTYYPTFKDMVHTELFEPLVKYCNNFFIQENSLYIVECKYGVTMGVIGNAIQGKSLQKLEDTCVDTNNKLKMSLDEIPKVYKFDIFIDSKNDKKI